MRSCAPTSLSGNAVGLPSLLFLCTLQTLDRPTMTFTIQSTLSIITHVIHMFLTLLEAFLAFFSEARPLKLAP